jgi:hypothetical protein
MSNNQDIFTVPKATNKAISVLDQTIQMLVDSIGF